MAFVGFTHWISILNTDLRTKVRWSGILCVEGFRETEKERERERETERVLRTLSQLLWVQFLRAELEDGSRQAGSPEELPLVQPKSGEQASTSWIFLSYAVGSSRLWRQKDLQTRAPRCHNLVAAVHISQAGPKAEVLVDESHICGVSAWQRRPTRICFCSDLKLSLVFDSH
eukprot:scaffold1029_cov364-Pinguiococcus_pyrenoidosus.AAC.4